MKRKKIVQYIVRFAIPIIILLFIYDIWSHGIVMHPGKALYKAQCSECHGDNGEGIKALVPPLQNSDFASRSFDSIPCWLKYGMSHPIVVNDTVYDQPMYPNKIDDIQAANVINFMSKEFFKSDREVNPEWVREKWNKCK